MPLRPEEENAKDSKAEASIHASAENNSPLLQEFWQSFKYSTIQQPYDGISQAINHFGGNIAKRNLVDAPDAADVGSSQWIAQQAGSGVARLGGVLLLHRGMSLTGAALGARTASTVALGESVATGRVTVGSLATAGGLYEGLVSKSGENFWTDRLTNAGIGGTSMYIMGKTQLGIQGLSSVKSMASHLPEGLSGSIGRHMLTGASGFFAGAAGGAFSAEASSLFKHGRLATTSELAEKTLSSAVMGGVLGSVSKPSFDNVASNQRSGALPSLYIEQLPVRTSPRVDKTSELGPDASLLVPSTAVKSHGSSLLDTLKLRGRAAEVPEAASPSQPIAIGELPMVRSKVPGNDLPQKLTDQHTPGV